MPQSTSRSPTDQTSQRRTMVATLTETLASDLPSRWASASVARPGLRSLELAARSRSGGRCLIGLMAIGLGCSIGACATAKPPAAAAIEPISESELAAKKLQKPLDQHLCAAAVYPKAAPDWKIKRVVSLQGRGENFQAALEALCREADGQKFPAVVDIYYERAFTAWSQHHAIRGTAIRYVEGFVPPQAPDPTSIKPPEMPKLTDDEPAPYGEGSPAKP